MALIGYARVSSEDQNLDRQIEALVQRGVSLRLIFQDKKSGKDTNRPAFNDMMRYVRDGDTLIVCDFTRLARNTRDLLRIVDELKNKQVELISIKEGIDTSTPTGKFMLTVFAALSELERDNIRERQRQGIEIAKSKGVYQGRKPIAIDWEAFEIDYVAWKSGRQTAANMMRRLKLKPNTFYRRVKEYEERQEAKRLEMMKKYNQNNEI